MFTDFYRFFYYSILIISAIISIMYFSKVDKTFKWVCILIILTLASELMAKFVVPLNLYKSNNIVYHIFTIVEYFMYTIIYKMFFKNKKWDAILLICFVSLTIAAIFNTIFFQPFHVTPTNIMLAESVLLVFLSLSLFIRIRAIAAFDNILKEGIFWFNSVVLFYYSFNILVWGFHNIMIYQLEEPPKIVYDILLLFSGLLYIAYTTSIVLNHFSTKKLQVKYE